MSEYKVCPLCKAQFLRWHQIQGIMLFEQVGRKRVYTAICDSCGSQKFTRSQAGRLRTTLAQGGNK